MVLDVEGIRSLIASVIAALVDLALTSSFLMQQAAVVKSRLTENFREIRGAFGDINNNIRAGQQIRLATATILSNHVVQVTPR